MTYYRCVVNHLAGSFVPYAGVSFVLASDAMRTYEQAATTWVERRAPEGHWDVVMGVWRG